MGPIKGGKGRQPSSLWQSLSMKMNRGGIEGDSGERSHAEGNGGRYVVNLEVELKQDS
jgi:hypothetical protein